MGGRASQAEALGVAEELGELAQGRGVAGARCAVPTPLLPGTGKPRVQAALHRLPTGVGGEACKTKGPASSGEHLTVTCQAQGCLLTVAHHHGPGGWAL